MENKIEKLNELGELLKQGTITKVEFDKLKLEILNSTVSKQDQINIESKTETNSDKKANSEKVMLKDFTDEGGKSITPPAIDYLNLQDISEDEMNLLKPFIRLKQIYKPNEMTADEIKLREKLFSAEDVALINSERTGFNFPILSIGAIVLSAFSLYMVTISPCLIIFGGSTTMMFNAVAGVTVFTNSSSTKNDKRACAVGLVLFVIAIAYYGIQMNK